MQTLFALEGARHETMLNIIAPSDHHHIANICKKYSIYICIGVSVVTKNYTVEGRAKWLIALKFGTLRDWKHVLT